MTLIKRAKDQVIKALGGSKMVPRGLVELHEYFRHYGPIAFRTEKTDDGLVAVSTNYRYGSIVTSGHNPEEVEKNIRDAILTSFEIPSSYAREAKIEKVGNRQGEYAIA